MVSCLTVTKIDSLLTNSLPSDPFQQEPMWGWAVWAPGSAAPKSAPGWVCHRRHPSGEPSKQREGSVSTPTAGSGVISQEGEGTPVTVHCCLAGSDHVSIPPHRPVQL